MKDRCANYWEAIVNLAEGGQDAAALAHLEQCTGCAEKLRQIQAIMAAGDLRYFDAPSDLIGLAKNIMPATERRSAKLMHSTTAWSGARVVAEDFQIVVGDGQSQIRLMYTRIGETWEILGRVPSSEWTVLASDRSIPVDEEGRFSFQAGTLADTAFTLDGPDGTILVPSAQELLANGPEDSH